MDPVRNILGKHYKKDESGKIVSSKQYGEHILIQDSTGKKYSTKNILPIGCRTMFDGEAIHGKNKKPDIILDYEL